MVIYYWISSYNENICHLLVTPSFLAQNLAKAEAK
jgi:hypothetical protein